MTIWGRPGPSGPSWPWIILLLTRVVLISAMSHDQMGAKRQEVVDMFNHGFDHYMAIAFPEDEIRPLTCRPLARDQKHSENIGLNDALGNISLTLIDSLSTLAVIASADGEVGANALQKFQSGVVSLVHHYGDGTLGPSGHGYRGRGFDVDSKVQVFETTIRGLGGLLSAHLFAIGHLPIRRYALQNVPLNSQGSHDRLSRFPADYAHEIEWPDGFTYDGQLLRLAHDLGERLLPAFFSTTGLPYPRVNLRHGIPFYSNSPLNADGENGQCLKSGSHEITETCSAGAGSLVLEFSTLSRLTGDGRFESIAKRAFLAVWDRRSAVDLVGAGIDAERGQWTSPFTGIGAGIDSFYEYALKSHILLSGSDSPASDSPSSSSSLDPNTLFTPLSQNETSADRFLAIWNTAHAAINRNVFQDIPHPHYINVLLDTGSPQYYWLDSLSAYYPGLLALAGHLEEAVSTHLLYVALWTRYSALPERWSARTGGVDSGLSWWGGRPEMAESTYYLYQATKDPWYLYVGSMMISDIKRRCWAKCGFSGIQDVATGELNDRMETFFLSETTKYLYLLFDEAHPLNTMDSSFVFNTEGHPLIIPPEQPRGSTSKSRSTNNTDNHITRNETCPATPKPMPLTISAILTRSDLFHAAGFARLHVHPPNFFKEAPIHESSKNDPAISFFDVLSPTNFTFFPWTVPLHYVPAHGECAKMRTRESFDIQFPLSTESPQAQNVIHGKDGIVINNLAGLGLGLVREGSQFRVYRIGSLFLGRDEQIQGGKGLLETLGVDIENVVP